MSAVFQRAFEVRWSDVDPNGHVRHSVYADFCASLRVQWLAANGFGVKALLGLGIGPVLFKETLSYHREILLSEPVTVSLWSGGMSETGHKWVIEHQIFKGETPQLAATLVAEGAWLNLKDRKVVAPPPGLLALMKKTVKSDGFRTLS